MVLASFQYIAASVLIPSDGLSHLRVLRMSWVAGVLCLLCDQSWVELLVAVDVASIDVLRWLTILSLCSVSLQAIKYKERYTGN